ncbi:MAG: hypothetical protein AB1553_00595 [Nitrospirota bacterium]
MEDERKPGAYVIGPDGEAVPDLMDEAMKKRKELTEEPFPASSGGKKGKTKEEVKENA